MRDYILDAGIIKWGIQLWFPLRIGRVACASPPSAEHSPWKSRNHAYWSVSQPRLLSNWLDQPNDSGSGNSPKVSQYGCERHLPLIFFGDGGRNDSVGFRPPCATSNSATTKFYPANLLGSHPSISLVADPPRRKIAREHFPSFLPPFSRVARVIIQLIGSVSSIACSGRIGAWDCAEPYGIEYISQGNCICGVRGGWCL